MHFFIFFVFIIIKFSHYACAEPLTEDILFASDFLPNDALIFNDAETSNLLSTNLTPQDADFSDDSPWLTDSSTPPLSDTTNLFFADDSSSSNTPLENNSPSLFDLSDDLLLQSSCGPTDHGFQPLSKRENGQACSATQTTEADDALRLKLPDLLNDFSIPPVGQESDRQQKQPWRKLEILPILPTPGYTKEDDKDCRAPRRRLCCEGPLGSGQIRIMVAHCRGMKGFLFPPPKTMSTVHIPSLFPRGRKVPSVFFMSSSSPSSLPLLPPPTPVLASRNPNNELILLNTKNHFFSSSLDMGPWPCPARYDVCCGLFLVKPTRPPL